MFCWSASREWFNGCGEACSEVHPRPKPKSSTARRRPRNLLRGAPTPGAAVLDHEAAAAQRGPRCAPQDIHARNRAGVLQENRQVHHGRIWGVNAEGPAGELAVHFRHDVLYAQRPPRQSFPPCGGPSNVSCVAARARTVVMRPQRYIICPGGPWSAEQGNSWCRRRSRPPCPSPCNPCG